MKIDEWMDELREQNIRLNTIQMGQVRESITIEGKTLTISLGKVDNIEWLVTRWPTTISVAETHRRLGTGFSETFRKHNEDFVNMLELIKQKVDDLVGAVNELFAAIVDQDIPELMIERMTGEQMGSEPKDLIQKLTDTKSKKLIASLEALPKVLHEITWNKDVAKRSLSISGDEGSWQIYWGELNLNQKSRSITQCLLFLANYEKIKNTVDRFILAMEAMNKILKD